MSQPGYGPGGPYPPDGTPQQGWNGGPPRQQPGPTDPFAPPAPTTGGPAGGPPGPYPPQPGQPQAQPGQPGWPPGQPVPGGVYPGQPNYPGQPFPGQPSGPPNFGEPPTSAAPYTPSAAPAGAGAPPYGVAPQANQPWMGQPQSAAPAPPGQSAPPAQPGPADQGYQPFGQPSGTPNYGEPPASGAPYTPVVPGQQYGNPAGAESTQRIFNPAEDSASSTVSLPPVQPDRFAGAGGGTPAKRSRWSLVFAGATVLFLVVAIAMTVLFVTKNSAYNDLKRSDAKTLAAQKKKTSTATSDLAGAKKQLAQAQSDLSSAQSQNKTISGQKGDIQNCISELQAEIDALNKKDTKAAATAKQAAVDPCKKANDAVK